MSADHAVANRALEVATTSKPKAARPRRRSGPERQLEIQISMGIRLLDSPEAFALSSWLPEYRFALPRQFRFDFAWPSRKVALEIDGGIWVRGRHARGRGITDDCEKACLAAIEGWRVLRVTPQHVEQGKALCWLQLALFGEQRI